MCGRLLIVGLSGLGLLSAPASVASQGGLPPNDLCASSAHHQLDFWVGRWDVFKTDDGQLVAHSLIEKLYGGCAIRENWFPLQGSGGGSLNVFRPATQSWHQTWVDSGNNINEYSGGMVGRKLVLTGTASDLQDRVQRVRMTLEPIVDGRVLQTGFNWSEADKSWALSYQLEYRPQAAPPQ